MLTLLKGVSRFEWVAIAGAVFLGLVIYHFINKYDDLTETVVVSKEREQQAKANLAEEQRSTAITDKIVLEYTLEREFKRSEVDKLRYETPTRYFQARDTAKPKETQHAPQSNESAKPRVNPTESSVPTPVEVDTRPDPTALAALASGMWDTYCTVAPHDHACTP